MIRGHRGLHFAVWVLAALWLLSAVTRAQEFIIAQAESVLLDEQYVINAEIEYHFSEVALNALENGVPLLVDLHVQVRRKGAWIWEADIVDYHFRRQLRYLPLSESYEVVDIADGSKRRFISRTIALEALGEISELPLVEAQKLQTGKSYRVEIKSELDIEALPVPLRPTAYMSSKWKLASEWNEWIITP
jgi:hypothetical protein